MGPVKWELIQGRGPIPNALGLSYMPVDCTDLGRQVLEPADLATRALCTNKPSMPLGRVTGNTATACEDHLSPFLPGPLWPKKMGRKTKIPSVSLFSFRKRQSHCLELGASSDFPILCLWSKNCPGPEGKNVCPLREGMCNEVTTYHSLDRRFRFAGKGPGRRPLPRLHVEHTLSAWRRNSTFFP